MAKTPAEMQKMLEGLLDVREKSNEKLREEIALQKKLLELTTDIKEQQELGIEIAQNYAKIEANKLEKIKELLKEETNSGVVRTSEIEKLKEELSLQDKLVKKASKKTDLLKEHVALGEGLAKSTKNLINVFTTVDDKWKGTFTGQIAQLGSFSKALSIIGKTAKETLTLTNIAGSGMMNVTEATVALIKQQDDALASFNKSSTAAGAYNDVIVDVGHQHHTLGITSEDASQALLGLREGMTDFIFLSKSAQKEAIVFSATLSKLGVSAKLTGANFQTLTKIAGMNTQQSEIAQRQMIATAQQLGIGASDMLESFQQAAPQLAAFGDQMVNKFRELSTVAKSTGIEVNRLLTIAKGFDTFESAGDAVGRLNAILGGPFLDSMEMIRTTDPTERIKLLRGAVKGAGLEFDQMNYYQRQAIASAAGLQDVAELSKLMSGELEKTAAAANANAMSQEDMAKAVAATETIMAKLHKLFMTFALSMRPVIDGVGWFIDKIVLLNEVLGNGLFIAIGVVMGAYALYKTVQTAAAIGQIAKIGLNIKEAVSEGIKTAAIEGSTVATETSGKVASKAGMGMLAFGAAVALVGIGVGAAAFGISKLAEAMKGMAATDIVGLLAVLVAFGGGIALLGTISTVAVIPLLGLGVAVVLISAGLYIASAAVAEILPLLSEFAGSMLMMLPGGLAAAGGLLALSVGLGAIALALAFIKTDDLKALGGIFESLSDFSDGTARSIERVAMSIGQITKAIDAVPMAKTITFATAMNEVKELGSQVERHRTVSNETGGGATAASSAGGGGGMAQVTLQLDGKILDKYIIDVFNKELSPRRA